MRSPLYALLTVLTLSAAPSAWADCPIRSLDAARNEFVDLDRATEEEMAEHEREFEGIAHGHPATPGSPAADS